MSGASHISFMTTPTSLLLSGIVLLLAAGLSWYAWQRGGYQRMHGWQELFRFCIVLCIVVLFNQPEWIEEYTPEEQPSIAVLWDASDSMQTEDVFDELGSSRPPQTRAQATQPLTEPDFWAPLADRWKIKLEPIAENSAEAGTNLHDPLSQAAERHRSLSGVVLISDGDWNAGRPPAEAAARMSLREIPVFTILAGSPEPLPDVELVQLDLPTVGITGKTVRIPITIDSTLPSDYSTSVVLTTSAGETLTQEMVIQAGTRTSDTFLWDPPEAGEYTVTVEIPLHPDEAIVENNIRTAPIRIRQEELKVLVVESYPRWEYRFLRNALSRDPGVELACLLFHPGLSKPGGGASDYIKEFPGTIEELASYDVVFLGDVGVEPGQLTEEDCRLLRGLIEQQASGLIFMPGMYGKHYSLLETELKDLYPVHLDPVQDAGWGQRTPAPLALTESGRRSLLTKLADTDQENLQVWETLPGFQWYAAVTRAKAGTETLAVHGEISNEYGRLPLIVTQTHGAGKVLFMGTDGAWRWRKGVEDLYHYRFWGQVIRWMAYQRNMAKGESMRLFFTPEQPQSGQTLSLQAHVMSRGGEPLTQGNVLARISGPSGSFKTVRLQPEGEEWGVFKGEYTATEPGEHQLALSCAETEGTLETSFYVQGNLIEPIGKPARPEVLEEIARLANGASFTLNQASLDEILQRLGNLPTPPPSIRRLQIWGHPLTALFIVLLLTTFWIWRKALGLI